MDLIKVFITFLLFLGIVVCEVYRVGDDSGWNSGIGTDYLSWSREYNFTAGDILVFKYSKAQHNVKEVTDATFRSCDARNGVIVTYGSGNDQIPLKEARKYNFICDKDNHCLGGMRFSINVSGGHSGNTAAPAESPIPLLPPPSQGENSAFTLTMKVSRVIAIVVLVMFML